MSSLPSTIADWATLPQCASAPLERFALIGAGANLPSGERQPKQTLALAIERLSELSPYPLVVSPILETQPEDCPPGTPPFLNAVMALYPAVDETPECLLRNLLMLEGELGRVRSGIRNEARVLDLDLLAFGREQRADSFICIPHPRASQRQFVLAPLAAIWPEYRFVGQSLTVDELLKLW